MLIFGRSTALHAVLYLKQDKSSRNASSLRGQTNCPLI